MARPNLQKPFGSAGVGTAASVIWASPGAGKAIDFHGGVISLLAAGTFQLDLLNGTAAASGTIHTFVLSHPSGLNKEVVNIRKLLTANTPLGLKARSGAPNIVATSYGREVSVS